MPHDDLHAVLDANIILSIITRDPEHQAESVSEFFGQVVRGRGRLILLPTVLMEVDFVLRSQYQLSLDERRQALINVVDSLYIETVDRPEILGALLIIGQSNAISFADAYHCAMARRHCNGNLVSFDRKLSGIDGVIRIEPGTAPA